MDNNITCRNTECSKYKDGHCTEMTYEQLLNKIRCDEREW